VIGLYRKPAPDCEHCGGTGRIVRHRETRETSPCVFSVESGGRVVSEGIVHLPARETLVSRCFCTDAKWGSA